MVLNVKKNRQNLSIESQSNMQKKNIITFNKKMAFILYNNINVFLKRRNKRYLYAYLIFISYIIFPLCFYGDVLAFEEPHEEPEFKTKIISSLLKTKIELEKKTFPIAIAAMTDRIVCHPAETIIGLKQSLTKKNYNEINFLESIKHLYKTEGVKGFYKGFLWPTLSAFPIRYTVFGSYYVCRKQFEELPPPQRFFYSGAIAGLVRSIASCPSEAERIRKICNIEVKNKFLPKNLFKGFIPLSIRHFCSVTPTLAGSDVVLSHYTSLKEEPLGPFFTALSISFMCQFITTPADMLKTRVMEDYTDKSLLTHILDLNRERKMIYRTFWPVAMRSSIGSAIMIGVIHLVEFFSSDEK